MTVRILTRQCSVINVQYAHYITRCRTHYNTSVETKVCDCYVNRTATNITAANVKQNGH